MDVLKSTKLADLKFIAIQMLFLMTFGLASFSKWSSDSIPDHYIERFSNSIFDLFTGSLFLSFYFIALLETLLLVLFLISIAKLEWLGERKKIYLESGLIGSLFVFVLLGFGLRATGDFGGAANLFFYFGATLIALFVVEESKTR